MKELLKYDICITNLAWINMFYYILKFRSNKWTKWFDSHTYVKGKAVLGHWYASCLTDDTRHCFLNELLKLFETEVEVREVSEGAKANLDRLQEFALLLIIGVDRSRYVLDNCWKSNCEELNVELIIMKSKFNVVTFCITKLILEVPYGEEKGNDQII